MRSSLKHILLTALVMLVTCTSCRKELCYDHFPAVDLGFTWEQEWERDYGMHHTAGWDPVLYRYEYDELRPPVPDWVKIVMYFEDGRITEGFASPEGKKFEVSADEKCSILFYNGDTEYIILEDVASLNDARATATTRSRGGSALQEMREMYNSSRTTNSPDVIFSAYAEEVEGVKNHEVRSLAMKMQPLVFTYLISFEFECGIEYVYDARGALGGMAEGVYLRTGVTTDQPSIILFDCEIHPDACVSQVRSFGIPAFPDSYFGRTQHDSDNRFTLNLEVRLKNGKTKEFNFDVTDQIKNQPRGGVIRVDGIKIEGEVNPPPSEAGFVVGVDDWGDDVIEVNLPLGPSTDNK
ncbi:MAG: DUF5119 domain-containing protein [Muribaculaceae bacterium]|nr:DUF5119 domain-containing protein [Muribaculaceae bacterium]